MTGVLRTLKDILAARDRYDFVDQPLLDKAQAAYDKGLACLLKCQIKVGDRLTAWCQQHDHRTLRPVGARSYEKPSIVTAESVGIVRFLMSIDNPPPGVVKAVESAVTWFDRVKIEGLRIEKVKAKPIPFKYHWNDYDLVEVQDPAAPPIWTRYYDLKTEQPFFCTRAGKIITDFTQLSRERRTGYSWYGYYPARLLAEDYPRWREKWAAR
jgi:PelA/Pel-15E family pectate lyase